VEFRILGPVAVVDDGRELDLGAPKQRALLALLVLHRNEPVASDVLVDLLWAGEPPAAAHKSLQIYVSGLRRVLGRARLETRGRSYLLHVDDGELDLDRFEALVESARETEPRRRADALLQALALFRGEPLANVRYEEFAKADIARLEELRLQTIEERIEAELACGREGTVLPELEALVASHPLRERLRGELMLALYRCGRQADALASYRQARELLDTELGLEPAPELRKLERRILEHDPTLASPRARRAARVKVERRAIAITVGAIVIAAGASIAAVLTSAGHAAPVRLRANSIAVFDAATGRAVGDIPLSFTPSDVAAGGDRVWVLNAEGKTVSEIDAKTLRLRHTIGLDGTPSNQWAAGTTDWVGLQSGIDEITAGASAAVKIPLWKPTLYTYVKAHNSAFACASFVTGSAGKVWVSQAQHFAELDANSGAVIRKLTLATVAGAPAGDTCYVLRYTGGRLFAARTIEYSIGTLDRFSGAYTPVITGFTGGGTGTGIPAPSWAAGFGSLWIGGIGLDVKSLQQQGNLTRIDLNNGQVQSKTVVGRDPRQLLVDPKSGIWILDRQTEALFHLDRATSQITRRISLHHFPCCPPRSFSTKELNPGMSVANDRIWVAIESP
jgi:DNA-binding SARP family transcriptional activator/DNA-binding beta-propeller fold protein YncE